MNGEMIGKPIDRLLQRADGLLLRSGTPKGRGVFASRFIPNGTVVEVSPVLIFSEEEVEQHTSQTCLQHYTYNWPSPNNGRTTQAIALGLGSMFNHSRAKQNVVWQRDLERVCIVYTTRDDVAAGEELCISYGNERLWFRDADAADSDDEWNKIREQKHLLQDSTEIELSGIGNINL